MTVQDKITCEYCREQTALEIHHILFRSHSGSDEFKNLIALCPECHSRAHGIGGKRITSAELLLKKVKAKE